MSWRVLMTWQLEAALESAEVDVDDVSHQHAGHAGVAKGSSETHFKWATSLQNKKLKKTYKYIVDLLKILENTFCLVCVRGVSNL